MFQRYIGIDYSGAQTPDSSLSGLRIFMADQGSPPLEVLPPASPRNYWTRRGIAEWLQERLSEDCPTLAGIDHGFSFPRQYFQKYRLAPDWTAFLEDFQLHWPTDKRIYVDFVRDGLVGNGAARFGESRWRRLTEVRTPMAKSVFHFDVPGSVAKSTHAGLPWLLYLRRRVSRPVHFWPFDGWQIATGRSVVAEVYPALWNKSYAQADRTPDQQDAYAIAAWMRHADANDLLAGAFDPNIDPARRAMAGMEGWILGVT